MSSPGCKGRVPYESLVWIDKLLRNGTSQKLVNSENVQTRSLIHSISREYNAQAKTMSTSTVIPRLGFGETNSKGADNKRIEYILDTEYIYCHVRSVNVQEGYVKPMDSSKTPICRFSACDRLTNSQPSERSTPEEEHKGKPTPNIIRKLE
eukprot:IDg12756t1